MFGYVVLKAENVLIVLYEYILLQGDLLFNNSNVEYLSYYYIISEIIMDINFNEIYHNIALLNSSNAEENSIAVAWLEKFQKTVYFKKNFENFCFDLLM